MSLKNDPNNDHTNETNDNDWENVESSPSEDEDCVTHCSDNSNNCTDDEEDTAIWNHYIPPSLQF